MGPSKSPLSRLKSRQIGTGTLAILFGGFIILVLLVRRLHEGSSSKVRSQEPNLCPAPLTERYRCHMPSFLARTGGTFHAALRQTASQRGVVMLSSLDSLYVDLAINFYRTSLHRLQITNHLFVCTDKESQRKMTENGIRCYLYEEHYPQDESMSTHDSLYGWPAFVRKTNIKTKLVLGALMLGYTVMFSDIDVVFFQNPLDYLHCEYCDILIMRDSESVLNTGLYLTKPSHRSIEFHKTVLEKSMCDLSMTQQTSFNKVIYDIGAPFEGYVKMEILDPNVFSSGYYYFEKNRRMFGGDNPCDTCVVMHNNWLVSKPAKIYRFKEHFLWAMDDDGYYSDKNRKYIVYNNPFEFGRQTIDIEIRALKGAMFLGHVINRTVILPAFHCHNCKFDVCKQHERCSIQTYLRLQEFDLQFEGQYREHVFLANPKVPRDVKQSISETLLIKSQFIQDTIQSVAPFTPKNPQVGAEPTELIDWFARRPWSDFSVLHFHSLYDVIVGAEKFPEYKEFSKKIANAFHRTNYRQIGIEDK